MADGALEEGLASEGLDPSVGFLYKTMLQRDPRKRRVKPVQKHLLQLNFGGLEDSSDDSDFEVAKHEKSESDHDSDADDHDSKKSEHESESSSQSESSSGEESGEEEEEEEEAASEEGEGLTLAELLEQTKQKAKVSEETTASTSSNKLKVLICCVCLGDVSEEDDEIVECDGCGVSVHEGCYGIAESQSVASTESSASTEPWFCDACKAGRKQPSCELCPNGGGIYKETDAGKWVHIVCALYTPGVAFGDVDRLSPVTLFEMPYSKWGARECSLCEDVRFSRTGVCICCDAGMCRNYFHVTCAQREGLLSEASPEEDIADPFYAYCKQHADKASVRAKRRNWLAIQSHYKQHKDHDTLDEQEKLRVERKLNRHRQKYLAAQAKRPPTWVPKEKMPRLLTTSSTALRHLMRKAELLGINTQVQATDSNKDIRKKWHVAPAFSVEFVSYYLDRNERMIKMKAHLKDLLVQRQKLQDQEGILRTKYDQLLAEVEGLKESSCRLRQQGEDRWHKLQDLAGKPLPLPEALKPKKVARSPRKDTPRSPPAVIHKCGICHGTQDQHLLAKCDKCRLYYHLHCLDPPLTRMPKKTRLMGWQCSECDNSGSEVSDDQRPNPDAPRRLREKIKIKEPVKFTPPIKEKKKGEKRGKGRRKKRFLKRKLPAKENEEEEKEMPVLKKERPYRPAKLAKPKDVRTKCSVCSLEGDNTNLVRCDECKLCYHFHCLDPPLKKSPKQRGYAWHCTACDPTEAEWCGPSRRRAGRAQDRTKGHARRSSQVIKRERADVDEEEEMDAKETPGGQPKPVLKEATVMLEILSDDDHQEEKPLAKSQEKVKIEPIKIEDSDDDKNDDVSKTTKHETAEREFQ